MSTLIGTHNGKFHCDEALACFMLKSLEQFSTAKIIRSRNPDTLAKCDIVVDVGGVYDPAHLRFDHHQRSFTLSLCSIHPELKFSTRLSSAGLVYAHYGREIIRRIVKSHVAKCNRDSIDPVEDDSAFEKLLDILYRKVYAEFVEEVDAGDNGISQFDSDIKPKFSVTTTLASRVAALNPPWNLPNASQDEQFLKAVDLTGREFTDRILYFYDAWWPARSIVTKAFTNRFSVDESGAILYLETVCPWKEHLFDIEAENNAQGDIKYCFFFDEQGKYFMMIAMPIDPTSFLNRLPFPEKWRGLRDDNLSKESEIDGCIFVHSNGFCGAHTTRDGALEMMRKSLRQLQ